MPPIGREAVESLEFPELQFDPPQAELHRVQGVDVLHLHDPILPLVDVHVRFRGGYSHFSRRYYAAATALPILLRNGGTEDLPPDSVDLRLERLAIRTVFGGGGGSIHSSINVLTETLDQALDLWRGLLVRPGFHPDRVEVWRGRELDAVRRRGDDPARLAFSAFNHLMYGEHPVGWEMTREDLEPEDLDPEVLRHVHARVVCRENMVLGITGDATWEEVLPRVRRFLDGWPPCEEALPEPPDPDIRTGGGTFMIPMDVGQSTIVMAHPTDLRQGDDPEYFASRIANSILGGGGFQSRLLSRVRTEEGYAYAASSLWTAPRNAPGLVGAVTRTRSAATVPAIRLMLRVMEEMREVEPRPDEVRTTIESIVHGFVFNFESPAQIVSRQMYYRAVELPPDWLERFVSGTRSVRPEDVHRVIRDRIRPDEMTILVVGDPDRIAPRLESLGPVTVLEGAGPSGAAGPGGR